MKNNKNIVIIVLVIILVLSLYFNFYQNFNLIKKDQENLKNADILFEKKQECSSYRLAMEKKLESLNFQNENVVITNHLDEIWFSPSMNSCLYSANEFWQYLKEKKVEYQYNIFDYLGNTLLINIMEVPGSISRIDALNTFNNRKEELKK